MSSIVFGAQLEVGLRVGAYRAHDGGAGADMDVAAVAADPDLLAHAGEHLGLLNVLEQGQIALLVQLLDGGDALKLLGQRLKPLLAGGLGKARRTSPSTRSSRPRRPASGSRSWGRPCRRAAALYQSLACSFSLAEVSANTAAICS